MHSKNILTTMILFLLLFALASVTVPAKALLKEDTSSRDVRNVADYPSIQDAINSLPATGGKVFIPAGLYIIISSIKITSNVVLTGEGFNTILKLADGANCNVIENMNLGVGTDENIKIEHLQIDGNKREQTGPANGIFLYGAPSSSVHHIWVHNFPKIYPTGVQVSAGINLLWSPKATIRRTIIENNSYSGIFVSFSNYATVSHNYFYGNHRGIYIRSSNNTKATKNTIINCDEGIRMYYGASYNKIIGNYIEGSSEEGIVITHETCQSNFIVANYLINNTVHIYDGGTNTKIRHNKLT